MRSSLIFLLAISTAGCGAKDSWNRQAVHGTITLDGDPVKLGSIRFEPLDGRRTASGSVVQSGQYSIAAPQGLAPGSYRVNISAFDPSAAAAAPEAAEAPTREPGDKIPAQYNRESRLMVEVVVDQASEFNFALESTDE